MAPPRPYWKGYLKLSLVSCPIALYTATSPSERVAFRQINKKTGNRLRQQLIDEESGEPIDPDDKGRGYEVEKGVYLRVEDEELEAIAIGNRRALHRQPVLSGSGEQGRPRGVRGHPRRDARQEHGRVGPGGPVQARARGHAPAAGEGSAWNHAQVPL